MRALIFAAGLGERMRPLTDHTPKPLLPCGGKPLIVWHLEKLQALGVEDVVINTSWLAQQFPATLGEGSCWGLRIHYVDEGAVPLETGGGMWNARHLLGDTPFLAVNGDVWCDIDFASLPRVLTGDAHLVMVNNPEHHPAGDFHLDSTGRLHCEGTPRLTYSGIGVYSPRILEGWQAVVGDAPGVEATPPRFRLAPLLRAAMQRGNATGTHHTGRWTDVGTPARLAALDAQLRA